MLVEAIDVTYPRFVIEHMNGETTIEEAEDDDDMYFYLEGQNFDGVLPFPNEREATTFLLDVMDHLRRMEESYDD